MFYVVIYFGNWSCFRPLSGSIILVEITNIEFELQLNQQIDMTWISKMCGFCRIIFSVQYSGKDWNRKTLMERNVSYFNLYFI